MTPHPWAAAVAAGTSPTAVQRGKNWLLMPPPQRHTLALLHLPFPSLTPAFCRCLSGHGYAGKNSFYISKVGFSVFLK